jgi:nicotinamidase-related amidase
MSTRALLVLDLQRDFLEEGGRMPIATSQMEPLLAVANAAIDHAAAQGVHVVYVLNEFPPSQRVLNFFRRGAAVLGMPGARIDPRVHVVPGATTLPKSASDAFHNPELDSLLRARGVEHLVVLGVFAPACVRATVRGALRHGYRVTVLRGGVGAASDGARDRALSRMAADGAALADGGSLPA